MARRREAIPMKIKTISDETWNEFYRKPFVFLGFHEREGRVLAVATFNDGLCEYREIADNHEARQKFFQEMREKYEGAPIAVLNQKTQRLVEELLPENINRQSLFRIYLKGPQTKLDQWEEELEQAMRLKKEVVSLDNPIKLFLK